MKRRPAGRRRRSCLSCSSRPLSGGPLARHGRCCRGTNGCCFGGLLAGASVAVLLGPALLPALPRPALLAPGRGRRARGRGPPATGTEGPALPGLDGGHAPGLRRRQRLPLPRRPRVYRERDPVFRRVAERLSQDACHAGGSLFVWGNAPMFYYYSGLAPASRFVVMAQSQPHRVRVGKPRRGPGRQAIVPEHWDWLMADLERARATYILDTEPAGIFRWDRYPVRDFPGWPRIWTGITSGSTRSTTWSSIDAGAAPGPARGPERRGRVLYWPRWRVYAESEPASAAGYSGERRLRAAPDGQPGPARRPGRPPQVAPAVQGVHGEPLAPRASKGWGPILPVLADAGGSSLRGPPSSSPPPSRPSPAAHPPPKPSSRPPACGRVPWNPRCLP